MFENFGENTQSLAEKLVLQTSSFFFCGSKSIEPQSSEDLHQLAINLKHNTLQLNFLTNNYFTYVQIFTSFLNELNKLTPRPKTESHFIQICV